MHRNRGRGACASARLHTHNNLPHNTNGAVAPGADIFCSCKPTFCYDEAQKACVPETTHAPGLSEYNFKKGCLKWSRFTCNLGKGDECDQAKKDCLAAKCVVNNDRGSGHYCCPKENPTCEYS